MAACCRTISRPAFSLFKSTISRSSSIRKPTSGSPSSSVYGVPLRASLTTATLSRPLSQMGCLQSLLPLHTAVSSARLTSCLGLDSKGSRSLSQGRPERDSGVTEIQEVCIHGHLDLEGVLSYFIAMLIHVWDCNQLKDGQMFH